eukprot:3851442-Pyramimonas_sp.AAC.1
MHRRTESTRRAHVRYMQAPVPRHYAGLSQGLHLGGYPCSSWACPSDLSLASFFSTQGNAEAPPEWVPLLPLPLTLGAGAPPEWVPPCAWLPVF